MKLLRPIVITLALTMCMLMIAEMVFARAGRPKGQKAAVSITEVILTKLSDGDTLVEISGGGFGNGLPPTVTLSDGSGGDGTSIDVLYWTISMIVANIDASQPDGEYTLAVSTGGLSKQNESTTISLGGTMTVDCIDWFRSGPLDEHVHTEVHVVDENGNAVIGAIVTWTASNDSGVYQTNTSATSDNDGHANGAGCFEPSGSGVTDWFCCIGAGKWDGEIPGKRACEQGTYTAEILSVTQPPATNMVWDGTTPFNEIYLDPKPQ